jgi:hypothetical protein
MYPLMLWDCLYQDTPRAILCNGIFIGSCQISSRLHPVVPVDPARCAALTDRGWNVCAGKGAEAHEQPVKPAALKMMCVEVLLHGRAYPSSQGDTDCKMAMASSRSSIMHTTTMNLEIDGAPTSGQRGDGGEN